MNAFATDEKNDQYEFAGAFLNGVKRLIIEISMIIYFYGYMMGSITCGTDSGTKFPSNNTGEKEFL